MATERYEGKGAAKAMTADTLLVLGDAGNSTVSRWLVSLKDVSGTVTVRPRGWALGAFGDPTASAPPLEATNVETGTPSGGAAVSVTANVNLTVPADGMSVALEFAITGGGVTAACVPLQG